MAFPAVFRCLPIRRLTINRMSYHRKVEFKGKTLACSREFKLKTVEFSPTQYLQLRTALKAMDYDERKAPVLATVEPPPNPS